MKKFFFILILGLSTTVNFIPPARSAQPPLSSEAEKDYRPALTFPKDGVWLNQSLDAKRWYARKVTLLYFWDYTTINCVRELDRLKLWHQKYRPYGLEFIFVHTPEFNFARKKENVQAAVERLGITAPVFLDHDGRLWDNYQNRSWPTKYLVNEQGQIVFSQVGEGRYAEIENKIREELTRSRPEAVLPEAGPLTVADPFMASECEEMSSELYVGYRRANWWGIELANEVTVRPDKKIFYDDLGRRLERGFFVQGRWIHREEFFEHARKTRRPVDYLGVIYYGYEAYAILEHLKEGRPSKVYVERDAQPVPEELRGTDIRQDGEGRTYVEVSGPRLYYLVKNEDRDYHELRLFPKDAGVAVYSFAFSNRCLSDFEHV